MSHRSRLSWMSRLAALSHVAPLALLACGGGAAMAPDGSRGGTCSADIPPGQACNALVNVGTAITPTCVTGAVPTGTGGTIVDGTYVLTSQTYYNVAGCSTFALSNTMQITGGCLQGISGAPFNLTTSATVTVQGNAITTTLTCSSVDIDGGSFTPDAPAGKTYTATATTFTLFSGNSAVGNPNPDRVEVFTKR